ncbi:MAG: sulfotransferase domain-containing protein [Rhizobiaceae bacterium]
MRNFSYADGAQKAQSITSGIIVGTRKAGTTWLYENFRRDPRVSVSELVKESGYFSGSAQLDRKSYDALQNSEGQGHRIEVDSSVCYADAAPDLLDAYNSEMRVVLIFREPSAFLASRHVHSLRKGELSEKSAIAAYENNEWLRRELDYPAITKRFQRFHEQGRLNVFAYEQMKVDPVGFYTDVLTALNVTKQDGFLPDTAPVNVSRSTKLPLASAAFSKGAVTARRLGLHGLVNALKSTGIHKIIETTHNQKSIGPNDSYAAEVGALVPHSVELHKSL